MQQAHIERVSSQPIESSSLVSTGVLEAARQRVANRGGERAPAAGEAFAVGATPGGQALLHGAGIKLVVAGSDEPVWRSVPIPNGVAVLVFRVSETGGCFERLNEPRVGAPADVTLPPAECLGAIALSDDGQDDIAALLGWWQGKAPDSVPPQLRWTGDGQARSLEDRLAGFLVGHLLDARRSLAKRVVRLQSALAELREEHETTQSVLTILRNGLATHQVPPIECRLALHPGGGFVTPPAKGDRAAVRQRLLIDSQGLAAVALHFACGRRPANGRLRIALQACESSTTLISWTLPYAQVRQGWNLFELPSVVAGPRQTVDLYVRWEGGLPGAPQLSLTDQFVGRGGAAAIVDGDAGGRALAMQLWTGLPGSRFVASAQADGGELLDSMAQGAQLYLSRQQLLEAELVQPTSLNLGFELLWVPDDGSTLQLHPTGGHVSQARIPMACPRGLARVAAMVRTESGKGPVVEYAMALSPVGVPLTIERDRPIEKTPDAIAVSDWVRLAPNTLGSVMLTLETPLDEPCDLHLATRLPAESSDAFAWARWRNFVLQLG